MKCHHCQLEVFESPNEVMRGGDADGNWTLLAQNCPACNRLILRMRHFKGKKQIERLLYPHVSARPNPSAEVPKGFAEDYIEASLVFANSAKASAALSRRCLQHILREKAGVKHQDLAKEIQQVLDSHALPSHLAEAIDAVRNIGNFAAHPIKSTASGEVVPVEPGEAEWNLDVLDGLFDFYFVQPAILKKRRVALDAKLADAGKPSLK